MGREGAALAAPAASKGSPACKPLWPASRPNWTRPGCACTTTPRPARRLRQHWPGWCLRCCCVRRRLLHRRARHAPRAHRAAGGCHRHGRVRGGLPPRARAPVPGGGGRCAGRLPCVARARPRGGRRRFRGRRPRAGAGDRAARCGRAATRCAAPAVALGRHDHGGRTRTRAARRGDAQRALGECMRPAVPARHRRHTPVGIAAEGRSARAAAGAHPGRDRRTAARPGRAAARRAAGRRGERALRDHAAALACLPVARRRPGQCRRRDRAARALRHHRARAR